MERTYTKVRHNSIACNFFLDVPGVKGLAPQPYLYVRPAGIAAEAAVRIAET